MIHCPQCGAANPDKSRDCSECGSALPAKGSGVLCPMCSHSNPVGRETCERCDARLVPLVASPAPEEPPQVTPPSAPKDISPTDEPSESPDAAADAPDWLRRMRASALTEDEGWAAEIESEPSDAPTERPDWLRRLDVESEEPESEPAEEEVPGWLAEIAPPEGEPSEEEPATAPRVEAEVPDWLAAMAPPEEEAAAPTVPIPAEEEMPDWLAEMAPPKGEPSEEEPAAAPGVVAEVPDWLAAMAPPEEEAAAPAAPLPAEEEVLDWLAETAPPGGEPSDEEPAAAPGVDAEVPDWLAAMAPPEEQAATPAAPLPAEEEMPDWLAEMAPSEEPAAAPGMEAEVPDWLAAAAPPEEEAAAPTAPLPAEEEVPDWLAEMAPPEAEPSEEEPAAAPGAEAEVPDWLAEMAVPEEEVAAPAAPMQTEEEVPDWLAEMAPPEGEPSEEEPAAARGVEAEVPDWLAEMAVPEEEVTAPTVSMPAEEEVPDWLAELIAPDEVEKDVPPPAIETEVPAEPVADVLDWVAETAPAEPEVRARERPADEEPFPEDELLKAPEAKIEVPDWMLEMAPPAPSEAVGEDVLPLTTELAAEPDEASLAQAEIPEWLEAMRPSVAPAAGPQEEEREVETSGMLAGIAGVVRPSSAITASLAVTRAPEQIASDATLARVKLWQGLIAQSAQPSVVELPRARVKKARDRVERWIVYAIVLLAVFVPVFMEVDLSDAFDLDQPLTPETQAAYELIAKNVTEDTPVLMAFDYDATFMGELGMQAEAVLRHLAQRQARLIAISLTPEGAGLAQQLLEDVLDEAGYLNGRDYANLGYLPGEAAGIRSLEFLPGQLKDQAFDSTDAEDALVFADGTGFALSNVSMIVVLTSSANDLRWWVEQTTALEQESDTRPLLLAGVSAAIEPLVRPYYDMASQQIDGLVVGLMGAVDYERELDRPDGPAHNRLGGQLVGQLTVFILIVIGVLVYGLSRGGDRDA